MNTIESLTARPRTLKELAAAYGVSTKTMRKWIVACPAIAFTKPLTGYYYSILQVQQIVEALGEP